MDATEAGQIVIKHAQSIGFKPKYVTNCSRPILTGEESGYWLVTLSTEQGIFKAIVNDSDKAVSDWQPVNE